MGIKNKARNYQESDESVDFMEGITNASNKRKIDFLKDDVLSSNTAFNEAPSKKAPKKGKHKRWQEKVTETEAAAP